jgi:hypothetical protein
MGAPAPPSLPACQPASVEPRDLHHDDPAHVSKDIKVTDKRIFTSEGELKDEFRFLEDAAAGPAPGSQPAAAPPPAEPPQPSGAGHAPSREQPPAPPQPEPEPGPRLELPGTPPGFGAPAFYDLVAILAEPVAIYLGDAELPDGQTHENLEMARLHIDLLDVLRQKTAGNLMAQESAVLEDVLYRLRLRYVQKRG